MYKVFVNNRPLFLTNKIEKETDFQLFLLNSADIEQLVTKVFENKIHKAFLYHPDEKEILSTLKSKIPVEKAAGGLVYNPKGEILFIYRNGKWDLPKGGIEKNEGKKEAAIREVEEETGVKNLKIIDRIDKTYHIFKRNGKFRLKITYWYKMETSFTENLIPQEEEGIEKAVWVQPNQVVELLENSYENIKLLF
jgi:8-oxo-dGTP pyrophosphatase MutT (NUDIX family)